MYIVCNLNWKPDVVVHTCNSSNWETEVVVSHSRIHCPLMYRIGVSATNVIKPQRRACMGNAYWRSKLCYIFKSFYCISVSARAHTCTHTCVHVGEQLMKIGSSTMCILVFNLHHIFGGKYLYLPNHLVSPRLCLKARFGCGRMGRGEYSG